MTIIKDQPDTLQQKILTEIDQIQAEDISFENIEANYLTRAAATVQIS